MNLLKVLTLAVFVFAAGCGKSDNQNQSSADDMNNTQTEKTSEKQTLQVSSGDKSVEIQCSGMTCTGCEKTIKTKVKKVEGVKDVIADHQTNVVKASFDPGKTDPKAISEAIESAGYEVVSVK